MTILTPEEFDELERYMANPTITPEGEALIRQAAQRIRDAEAKCAACPHLDCCKKRGQYL